MIDFLIGLFGNMLAGELAAWGPRLANKIISYSARKLSPKVRERMLEEWRALLADTPGGFSKLMTAISLFRSRYKIRDEFQVEQPMPTPTPALHTLTLREMTILNWVKNGKTNWEIAKIIGVSERTIRFHVESIFSKLDVTSRSQAVAHALEGRYWKPNTNLHLLYDRPIYTALTRLLFMIQVILTCRLKHGLTKQEFSVLLLMATGRSYFEMAATLGVSYEAIRSHHESIFSKLPTESREEVISRLHKYNPIWYS